VVRHTYDAAGLPTKTKYPSTYDARRSITVAGDSIVRTYDAMGRLATAWNAQGTVTRTYHREGTLKTETQQVGGSVTFSLRYWYDTANRRTRFYNGMDTLTYSYGTDGLVSLLKVRWMAGGISADSFRFKWDGLGRRDSIIYTNGTRVGFGYDRDGRLRLVCSVHSGGGTDDYLDHRLRYPAMDQDGMPWSMVRTIRTAACSGGFALEIQNNTYDGRHQLLSQNALGILSTFQYDASGNLTSKQVGSLDPVLYTVPDLSNRVTEERVNGQLMAAFKYNLNGDRVFDSIPTGGYDGIRHLFYNAVGQMTGSSAWIWNGNGWTMPTSGNSCRYDALGRRILGCEIMGVNPWLGFDGETGTSQRRDLAVRAWPRAR
jgi:YD repeat-containing protein